MQNAICFFNTAKVWGGGEKWHFDLSKYLFDKAYKVVVICLKNSDLHKKIKQTGIKHFALNIHEFSYLNPVKIKFLSNLFKNEKIDTIVMNLSSDVKLAAHAAKRAGVKRIIYRRGSAIPLKNTFYNRYIFKNWVNEILANSEETKRTINQNNPNLFPKHKIKVIYNGINIFPYKNCQKNSSGKLILGNIARLEYQKGHKNLIDIAKILKDKGLDFELRIVGQGSLYNQLKQQIVKYKLTNQVKLLGFRSDVDTFLKDIDIFLLSSLWEGFGYVITEAMACFIPVVAYDISSNPEIIEEGKTGYLVPLNDNNAFANAVLKLAENKSMRITLGNNARRRVEKLFNKERSLQEVEYFLTKKGV